MAVISLQFMSTSHKGITYQILYKLAQLMFMHDGRRTTDDDEAMPTNYNTKVNFYNITIWNQNLFKDNVFLSE